MSKYSKHLKQGSFSWQQPVDIKFLEMGDLHLWRASFKEHINRLDIYSKFLSPDETERANRFHFDIHRNQFIIARGILRQLLGDYLSLSPASILFKYTDYRKPFLADQVLRFNISHSGDQVLFAFTLNNTIGVDVEKIDPTIDIETTASRFFAPAESTQILALPAAQQAKHFFYCWTRKEAFIKAHGEGLSLPLDQFEVPVLEEEELMMKRIHWAVGSEKSWCLLSFDVAIGYLGAAVVKGERSNISFFLI